MKYDIRKMNLFDVPDDYCYAHCISADKRMRLNAENEWNEKFSEIERDYN